MKITVDLWLIDFGEGVYKYQAQSIKKGFTTSHQYVIKGNKYYNGINNTTDAFGRIVKLRGYLEWNGGFKIKKGIK